jgi:hypothetical protein
MDEKAARRGGQLPRLPVDEPWRETGHGARLSATPGLDESLAALALLQNGVFTIFQLADIGLPASGVHSRVRRSRLYRVHFTVYSLVPPLLLTCPGQGLSSGSGTIWPSRGPSALASLCRRCNA